MTAFKQSGIFRLMVIAGEKKAYLMISGLFSVLSSICALVPYMIIYMVLIQLLEENFKTIDMDHIVTLGMVAAGIVLLRYLLLFISTMFSHVAAFTILYNLRSSISEHLGRLPMGYFTANRMGKTKKIIYEDVEEIEQFIAHHIPDLVSGVALPVMIVLYLFIVDWKMALVALIPLPLAFFFQQKAFDNKQQDERRQKYHDALENMNATIVEYVRGMPVVKIFNQSVESFTRLKDAANAYQYFIKEITLNLAPSWAAFVVITSSGLFFILPFGIWFYTEGVIALPVLLLFLLIGTSYMTPLFKLAYLGGQMGHILEGVKRIDGILNQPVMTESKKRVFPVEPSLIFENVSFGYGKKTVLEDICFSVGQKELVALIGPSGAGKSTIAQLILRMWDIEKGRILLGGADIRDIPRETLMDYVGFVFQDVFILSDTVFENIRMGMPGVTKEAIMAAARAAQCDTFIKHLPKGLDTKIGEGGTVHLSGGEKQRISIARVILKNPPFIILDEATAYADAENEAKIQKAFTHMMQDKTVMIIAHRLSTIVHADKIIVMKDGRIKASGKHEALIENSGIYHDMWQAHTLAREWTLKRSMRK